MKWMLTPALLAALALGSPALAQVVFTEDFDDSGASSRWSDPIVDAELGVFDGQVDYAFDYASLGIPAAPGGGSGIGALFEVNTVDDGPVDEGVSVGIVPLAGSLPAGSYRVTMDVYFNVELTNGGTTEYGTFGVHASGPNFPGDDAVQDDVPFRFGLSQGDGLTWQATGDAGSATDFFRYEDAGNADTGSEIGLFSYDALAPGLIPGVSTGSGALGPANTWVTIEIERVGANISFLMNGVELDSITDLAGDYSGGTVLIGYNDAFNSAASTDYLVGPDPTPFDDSDGPFGDDIPGFAHFAVFDNVVIESIVPEPTSAVLGVLALAGLGLQRRR